MMEERGVLVDLSSINGWTIRFVPLIEKLARTHKSPVGGSCRMDEKYIKVERVWKELYRAVEKQGKTIDFLLTAKRFSDNAMGANGEPDKIAMNQSGDSTAAIDAINASGDVPIVIRQV